MILAPLRGVTIRRFREVFADVIREAGFTEAFTPFITAAPGYDPLQDRELKGGVAGRETGGGRQELRLTPQFIGKDPEALRVCLGKVKAAGYDTADLNCGCPFPMVRNKGRGSGLLRTPDVLRQMLEVGCAVMGPGKFSVKARLGVERNDELVKLMPLINLFPLRFLTVHARTAKQMYEGACDMGMFEAIRKVAEVPLVYNGDVELKIPDKRSGDRFSVKGDRVADGRVPVMVGRSFVRHLGTREDIGELLDRYVAASKAELCGERPVLGRMKELIAYWKDLPQWKRRWNVVKVARSLDELKIW